MIKLLRINNIALIASLELELGPGLVLLTGETGAGKSIVIDALGLLLGDRASPELIRSGEDKAAVEAVFEVEGLAGVLEERGLPTDGNEVVIRREVQAGGKGRATVNGALVPLTMLRDLAPRLAVIHGQHEPQGLLDPQSHLTLLDHFAGDGGGRPLAEFFKDLRAAETALERLRADRREAERRREMLEFQAAEIEKSGLAPGEEDALRVEKARQANAGRLATLSGEAYSLLYDDEEAVLGRLGQVFRRVEELATIDPAFQSFVEAKPALLAPLEDVALRLRDYRETLEVSPGRVDEIESRLAQIERLKKKYGATVGDVIAFGERCRRELDALGTPEEQERALEERRQQVTCCRRAGARRRSSCANAPRRNSASSRWRRPGSTSRSTRPTSRRQGTRPVGPSVAWRRPSSCSRRTPARS